MVYYFKAIGDCNDKTVFGCTKTRTKQRSSWLRVNYFVVELRLRSLQEFKRV